MKDYFDSVIPKIKEAVSQELPEKFSEDWMRKNVDAYKFQFDSDVWEKAISKPFYELLGYGGKLVRPVVCNLTYQALGGKDDIFKFTVIPELLHQGSLIVDDIEDHSGERRGKPTIHNVFGIPIAINAGNFLYFYPYKIVSRSDLDSETKEKIRKVIDDEMLRVHFGQGMDIYWSEKEIYDVSAEEYLQMTSYKTGSMLSVAAKVGAILAEVSENDLKKIDRAAKLMGLIYQLQDDKLDLLDGKDITEGKLTYLVCHTVKNSEDKDELIEILKEKTTDKTKIKRAQEIVKKSGAIEVTDNKAQEFVKEIKEILDDVMPDSDYKRIYFELIDFFVERSY